MKERPILFSGPLVRAILKGRKTQTRRVVKPIPQMVSDKNIATWDGDAAVLMRLLDKAGRTCPYGGSGARLWVRETFRLFDSSECACYDHCNCMSYHGKPVYRATADDGESKWTPSIHMPRWASRITLEITNVRVERLQDISESDANSEGCMLEPFDQDWTQCRRWFMELWESINGAGSWDANPWVWVIEFKRVL